MTAGSRSRKTVTRGKTTHVIAIFCCIPPKRKGRKDLLAADRKEHGDWIRPTAEILNREPHDMAFTDGSCLNNGKPDAAAGAGVFHGEGDERNISQPLLPDERQTNNRGELTAILLELAVAEPLLQQGLRTVPIGTDSQYAMHMFGAAGRKTRARGWKSSRNKPAANKDLVKLALTWRDKYGHLFVLIHVYAHTGNTDPLSVGNAGADRAAVSGALQAGRTDIIPVRGPAAAAPSTTSQTTR